VKSTNALAIDSITEDLYRSVDEKNCLSDMENGESNPLISSG
jgi:hypothetical protein